MTDSIEQVMYLIFGRWRSQTLYAGAELGVNRPGFAGGHLV